jgi:hypothetical protein
MHAKRIGHLRTSKYPTGSIAWYLLPCGLVPASKKCDPLPPIIGTLVINGTIGDKNLYGLQGKGRLV